MYSFSAQTDFSPFGKAIAGFITASKEAAYQRKMAAYQNKMARLQAGRMHNTITINQQEQRAAEVRAKLGVQRNALKASAAAEVSAASVGASGGSVEDTLFNVGRNEARKSHMLSQQYDAQVAAMENQRHAIELDVALRKVRPAPGPNVASLLFDLAGLGAQANTVEQNRVQSNGTNGLLI